MEAHYEALETRRGVVVKIREGRVVGEGAILASQEFIGDGNRGDEIRADWAAKAAHKFGAVLVDPDPPRGPGRPKKDGGRSEVLQAKCSPEVKEAWHNEAKRRGIPLSDLVAEIARGFPTA